MKIASFLALYICLLFINTAVAGTLKGKVTDNTGNILPYATIYVEGTTTGANANIDGYYELQLQPGVYTIICQYIGYKQARFTVTVKGDEMINHSFTLATEGLEMKEVVIRASTEDPAYNIIRQTIKRRKFHLDQVNSFQSSIYLKGVIRMRDMPEKFAKKLNVSINGGLNNSGKGVLYLVEENADYYNNGTESRTVIKSVHESGNPNGLGASRFPTVITFYENNIKISSDDSRGYISPIGDNALNYYKYKLLGQFTEKEHTIYKIEVIQKRPYEPCFNGYIYIVDSDFAIHSLNMTLTKKSGLDEFDTLKLDQVFLPVKPDNWVIKSQVIYFAIDFMGFDATAGFVTVYNDQKVNEPIADSVFANKITSSYNGDANKKDSSYWASIRPIPLVNDEKKDLVVKDSIFTKVNNPAYKDSIRKKGNRVKVSAIMATGLTENSKDYKNTYSFNSLLLGFATDNVINYNIAEGLNIAPKMDWRHFVDTGKYLHGSVATRYGFSNTHFNAIAKLYYTTNDRNWRGRQWLYGIEGGKYVFQYNPDNPVTEWFNTYSALLYRQNDLKIYERWDAAAYLGRKYGNGLEWFVKTAYQERLPLTNTSVYSIFPNHTDPWQSNIPSELLRTATAWEKHDALLVHAIISYQPGITYTQYPGYKKANRSDWPVLSLTYDKGLPDILNSKVNFDKWRFGIRSEDINLKLLGSISYNVALGGFLNSNYVSVPDLMQIDGNRGIGFASTYLESYQFAQYYQYSNKAPLYEEIHIEYHLNGLLSNKIPLLRQARWYLLFGTNTFYATQSNYYYEAFVGLDNIGFKVVRVLRIDFVQSWDSNKGRNSGFRFGFNIPGLTNKNNPTHSEW